MKKSFSLLSSAFALIAICGFIFNSGVSFAGTPYNMQDLDNLVFPPAGWTVANTSQYNWIRTSYASGYGQGTASAVCDFYDYASGNFDLITSTLPVTTAGDSLVFDEAYATGVGGYPDRLDLFTSNDGGSTWTLLISLAGGTSGPLVTAPATNHLFVPTNTQWATKGYSLPVGTNKIKFEGVTGFGNNLYIDNIKIGSRYNNDVGADAIVAPKWGMAPATVAPKASVRNYGTTTQSFNVTMTINPGGYSNTQAVSNLAPGATTLLTFSNFSFAATNTYTIKTFSTLGGDQNIANDTITSTCVVTNTPRNIVLEYCTGTWCQWCPCGDNEAHNLVNAYPNTVVFAYHGASTDPWQTFNGQGIIGLLGFTGYPSGLIDRRYGPVNNGWGSFFTDGEYRYSQSPAATVNVTVTNLNYNSGTGALTVNFNATALTTLSGQYKVNYIITEDHLVYSQTGNSYCAGSSTWVHDDVVRSIINTTAGDNVNSGTWTTGQVYPLTTSTTVNAAWVSSNCKINVIIFKDNGSTSTDEIQQGMNQQINPLVGIHNENNGVPKTYTLEQNYPNPFNPTTNIHFSIPKDGEVSLKIYNTLGQLVATQLDGFVKAGNYNAEVDAANLASGTYFYTLSANDFVQTKKMILVK